MIDVVSKILIYSVLNLILLSCLFLVLSLFDIALSSDFCSLLVFLITTLNIRLLLKSVNQISGYKPHFLKSFCLSMTLFIFMVIEFDFVLHSLYSISFEAITDPREYLMMIFIFCIPSAILGYFFRSKNHLKLSQENVPLDDV